MKLNLIERIKNWFLVRTIQNKSGTLHFKRWRLINTPFFSICIHYIAHADEDVHLHNHPWDFVSIILKGGYVEYLYLLKDNNVKLSVTSPGSILFRNHKDYHRVISLKSPTYTLVFMSKRYNDWGYMLGADNNKIIHIPFDIYRKIKNRLSKDSTTQDWLDEFERIKNEN